MGFNIAIKETVSSLEKSSIIQDVFKLIQKNNSDAFKLGHYKLSKPDIEGVSSLLFYSYNASEDGVHPLPFVHTADSLTAHILEFGLFKATYPKQPDTDGSAYKSLIIGTDRSLIKSTIDMSPWCSLFIIPSWIIVGK